LEEFFFCPIQSRVAEAELKVFFFFLQAEVVLTSTTFVSIFFFTPELKLVFWQAEVVLASTTFV